DGVGLLGGVGEAIVEGFEGGTVSACAEGGHVEDITDRHPTTVDAAVSLELAAVEVIGARPTRAAICLRLIFPSSGNRAMSVKASTGPTPGIEDRRWFSWPNCAAATHQNPGVRVSEPT